MQNKNSDFSKGLCLQNHSKTEVKSFPYQANSQS